MSIEIRATEPADVQALQTVLDETGLFRSEMLPEILSGFLGDAPAEDVWLTCRLDGQPVGFCYAVPEQLADGTWNMLALAIRPLHQARGLGAALVASLEGVLRDRGQRILIVDTSGTDGFALTRRFYEKNGYNEEARIRDFWAEGDDKVVFWKSLG